MFVIFSVAYGLVIGSFLNVIIYRVPRDLSIIRPGSACPNCSNHIAWYDNIPVASWLVLRGHCRHCKTPISPQYVIVELLGGILFGSAAARYGVHWDSIAFMALFAGLLALSWIDAEHLRLPTKLVYVTTVAVGILFMLASTVDHEWHRFLIAAICAAAWFVAFFLLNFLAPRYLGFGDVRLSVVLGLSLGWLGVGYVLVGFFLSNLIGLLISGVLIAMKRLDPKHPVPYGVFLSIGTVFMVIVGPSFMTYVLSEFHI